MISAKDALKRTMEIGKRADKINSELKKIEEIIIINANNGLTSASISRISPLYETTDILKSLGYKIELHSNSNTYILHWQ